MNKLARVFLSTAVLSAGIVGFILLFMWFWFALWENGQYLLLKAAAVFVYLVVVISLIRLKDGDL